MKNVNSPAEVHVRSEREGPLVGPPSPTELDQAHVSWPSREEAK